MTKLRSEYFKQQFNLSNTVEALESDPKPIYLKNKRKSIANRSQQNYKITENIEFLKEVSNYNVLFIDVLTIVINNYYRWYTLIIKMKF